MIKPVIVAVGNAPTALFSICQLVKEKNFNPVAVIGVPVGFVNPPLLAIFDAMSTITSIISGDIL